MENISGSTSPVPMPCTTLPTIATPKLLDIPLTVAPTTNAPSAMSVSLRAGTHFTSKLENGSTMPMASMYPTTSHCAMASSTPNAADRLGNAMFSAVSLYIPVKPPR